MERHKACRAVGAVVMAIFDPFILFPPLINQVLSTLSRYSCMAWRTILAILCAPHSRACTRHAFNSLAGNWIDVAMTLSCSI